MTDYLNPHHVYIDAHNAPDLSMNVKRVDIPANIVSKTVDTPHNPARTDADKGVQIMDNRINRRYGGDTETPAERIIRLYRLGMSHVDIAGRGFDLADVRRVISEATRADETLYQVHKEGRA
jgi:hypothetical protein